MNRRYDGFIGEVAVIDKIIEARSAERAAVAIGANLRTSTGRRAFVAVVDLTPSGCCIFAESDKFAVGLKETIHPDGLSPVGATVRWAAGQIAGIQFDTELYPAVIEHFARTHPWTFTDSAKLALHCDAVLSKTVKRELMRTLERAEAIFRERSVVKDLLLARPPIRGSRPGLAPQANRKITKLYSS